MVVKASMNDSRGSTSDKTDTSPKLSPVGQRLDHIVKYSLDRFQFRNATFVAERLYYETRGAGHTTEEREYAQYLLATCHYRQGQPELAWASLDGCTSIRNRYLFAQCCLDLRRYAECNGILEWLLQESLPPCSATDVMTGKNAPRTGDPDRASVLNLMGRTARHEESQDENMDDSSTESSYKQVTVSALDTTKPKQTGLLPPLNQQDAAKLTKMSEGNGVPSTGTILKRGKSFARTNSTSALTARSSVPKRKFEKSATALALPTSRSRASSNERSEEQATDFVSPSVREAELQELEVIRAVADIFKILARAYGLFSQNKFVESLAEYELLPYEHLASGWVQCQLAKNKFEMTDYATAAQYFQRARELEPSIHRDMEIYSTCLWHLKQEMRLSALGKELKDSNHHSPQAWCALGNAYSLRNENDQALKCFQRAIQLDDRFAYAHTLSGHEYKGLEEYDKSLTEYRAAISIDPRHYPAWCGMGDVYTKVGKNDLALIHYKEAQKLNPSNTVVIFLVGVVQERMNRTSEALRSFEEAIHLQPGHAMARFEKAKVQKEMGFYAEALKELDVVHKIAPTEPRVFMLQGEILLEMGDKKEALKKLTWALDLDSKSSHAIRDLIDKVNQDSDAEEEEPFEIKHDMD
ncbi:anaphase-promoting complex subunit cdc27 [Mortierella sp. NVP41]|nr:anaphase-promoting complex subunit cdc27 [Mortierella sp. NVP41]